MNTTEKLIPLHNAFRNTVSFHGNTTSYDENEYP